MKTKILILTLFLSFLASGLSSCQDEISDVSGSWVCNPEPNVTITLTFNHGYVGVDNSIYDIDLMDSMALAKAYANTYVFNNMQQFTVHGNKLYFFDPMGLTPTTLAFTGTMLSSNIMSLHYVGELDDFRYWIRDYTFERK